jgi:superfamily II DNA or RNA helicase
MSRTLRSKKLRSALYLAAGGKCQLCGVRLQEGWHADHIEPWCKTKRTNVHEMQALCPPCNLRKGSKTMGEVKLRKHQMRMREIVQEILSGDRSPSVTAHVCPGGGKTLLGTIFGSELVGEGAAEAVLWCVPRSNLQSQTVDEFYKPGDRLSAMANRHGVAVGRPAEKVIQPDMQGAVVTYQWLRGNIDNVLQLADSISLAVVFDEVHTLGPDGQEAKAAKRLLDASTFSLIMTGTPYRGDEREPLLLLDYEGDKPKKFDLEYTIKDALKAKPPELREAFFTHWGGDVVYPNKSMPLREAETHLGAIFRMPAFWQGFLDNFCTAFKRDRAAVKSHTKAIVLAPCVNSDKADIRDRRFIESVADYIGAVHGLSCVISVSEDAAESDRVLTQFRQPGGADVLVTVGKAYMGFDCKEATHMAFLSAIRTKPHAAQSFARVMRVKAGLPDHCSIQVPGDPRMYELADWFTAAQEIPALELVEASEETEASNDNADQTGEERAEQPKEYYGPVDFQNAATEIISWNGASVSGGVSEMLERARESAHSKGFDWFLTLSVQAQLQAIENGLFGSPATLSEKPSVAKAHPPATEQEKGVLAQTLNGLATRIAGSVKGRFDRREQAFKYVNTLIADHVNAPRGKGVVRSRDWTADQLRAGIEFARSLLRQVA